MTDDTERTLGPVWVQLHHAPPGPGGALNRVADLPRSQAIRATGVWDQYGLDKMHVEAVWPEADRPTSITDFTVWNSPIDGRCIAAGLINPPISLDGLTGKLTLVTFPDGPTGG